MGNGPDPAFVLRIIPIVYNSTSALAFRTPPGFGAGYNFRILPLGIDAFSSAYGTDRYNYVQVPVVTRISGCTDTGNATANCPTTGGVTIVMDVLFLGSGTITVRIGANDCVAPHRVGNSSVACTLPPGAGQPANLVLLQGIRYSEPNPRPAAPGVYLAYATPEIFTLGGSGSCQPDPSSAGSVKECNRLGGDTLVVMGRNFGEAPATVVVAGKLCLNVTHDPITPHFSLNCTLPPGSYANQPVILVQLNVSPVNILFPRTPSLVSQHPLVITQTQRGSLCQSHASPGPIQIRMATAHAPAAPEAASLMPQHSISPATRAMRARTPRPPALLCAICACPAHSPMGLCGTAAPPALPGRRPKVPAAASVPRVAAVTTIPRSGSKAACRAREGALRTSRDRRSALLAREATTLTAPRPLCVGPVRTVRSPTVRASHHALLAARGSMGIQVGSSRATTARLAAAQITPLARGIARRAARIIMRHSRA
jgi:hypothetical protein